MILPTFFPGPIAIDIHDFHEWVTTVHFCDEGGASFVSWHGGHHHVNRLSGPISVEAGRVFIPTEDHGIIVFREIGPEDTWPVSDGQEGGPAWEVYRRGLR